MEAVAESAPDHGRALLAIYDDAIADVYGYLVRRCPGPDVAEELTSETFLAALTSIRRGAVQEVTVAWLVGIARHKLVDHWRRAERDARKLHAVEGQLDDTDDPWDATIDQFAAWDVLERLGAHHRSALTLRYLDGLPVAEVASHLDRTVGATEALLTRAKAAFRVLYDEGRTP